MARKRTVADIEDEDQKVHVLKTLVHLPKRDEANQILQKLVNHTRELMKQKKWKVSLLCEFYPKKKSLLGLNVNHGYRIMIRLRCPNNSSNFLPYESLLGTMIHELTHIEISAHSFEFYQMVDELSIQVQKNVFSRDFQDFSYEFSQGKGQKLGGKNITYSNNAVTSNNEVIRQARQKKFLQSGSSDSGNGGRRLGGGNGNPDQSSISLRELRLRSLEVRISNDHGTCSDNQDENQLSNEELSFILQHTQEISLVDDSVLPTSSSSSFSSSSSSSPLDADNNSYCQPCKPVNQRKSSESSTDDPFLTQFLSPLTAPPHSLSNNNSDNQMIRTIFPVPLFDESWKCSVCLENNSLFRDCCHWCGSSGIQAKQGITTTEKFIVSEINLIEETHKQELPKMERAFVKTSINSPISLIEIHSEERTTGGAASTEIIEIDLCD
jgi:hypothetical protein